MMIHVITPYRHGWRRPFQPQIERGREFREDPRSRVNISRQQFRIHARPKAKQLCMLRVSVPWPQCADGPVSPRTQTASGSRFTRVTGEVGFDALVYSQTPMPADAWHRMATARRATPLRPDQNEYGGTEYGGLPVGDGRCSVLLGLSSPTDVRDSRHVTEPSEWVGPRPSAIGYVAK